MDKKSAANPTHSNLRIGSNAQSKVMMLARKKAIIIIAMVARSNRSKPIVPNAKDPKPLSEVGTRVPDFLFWMSASPEKGGHCPGCRGGRRGRTSPEQQNNQNPNNQKC
jgi:hypothetical protein